MTAPTNLETARADALLAALERRRTIKIDAAFLAARRKLGWSPSATMRAAEILGERGCAHFRAAGEDVVLIHGSVDGEVAP
ncbi:MAG: hypothetical protein HY827_10265 [Actinobacteria bacterium]|nr:hypothetical protein [Actinomycetota bacterium]